MDETIDKAAADPQDWITIWQSQLAALAADRESLEALAAGALAWKAVYDANAAWHDGSAGRAGPDAPLGAEAAGPASGAGSEARHDVRLEEEFAKLRVRVAELERAAAALRGS